MLVVVQLLAQTKDSEGNVIAPTLPQITTAAMLNWEQCTHMGSTTSKGKNSGKSANKINAIKHKRNDPSFQKQQDPAAPSGQQQGGSAKDKEKGCGKHGGKKQKKKRERKYLNFIELKDFRFEGTFSYFVHTASIPAIMDPHIAAHQLAQLYQETNGSPVFTQTQESFNFAHCLDFSSPVIPSPSSSLLTPPPASILSLLVSHIEIISEDNEPIIYNCAFSMEDLNTPLPSKRSQKWVYEVSSSWGEDDEVNIYGSDKDISDLYNQYMKDPRYMAFSIIAAPYPHYHFLHTCMQHQIE